jgi:hypothetical protein
MMKRHHPHSFQVQRRQEQCSSSLQSWTLSCHPKQKSEATKPQTTKIRSVNTFKIQIADSNRMKNAHEVVSGAKKIAPRLELLPSAKHTPLWLPTQLFRLLNSKNLRALRMEGQSPGPLTFKSRRWGVKVEHEP